MLKNKNFLYLWSSQILSQLTINIMNFVFLIRLFEKTGSTIATSFLWVAYSLPAIMINPVASATVDMTDRRKMLIVTNLLQSLTIFLFALSKGLNIFLLYEVVFIYSLLNQFYVPAESAALPSVVVKNKLTQANGLFFLTMQGSIVVGFGVAGLIYGLLGFEKTLFMCSIFLFMAFVSVIFLPKLATAKKVSSKIDVAIVNFLKSIVEGYKFIKANRIVLTPFLILLCFQVSLQVIIVCVPAIAKNLLAIPLNTAGVFILVPAALGAISGVLGLPRLIKKGWRKKKIIENSLLALSIMILLIIYVIPLFGYTAKIILLFISIFLSGLFFIGVIIPSQTFLQESTPKDLMGRVFGNFWFLVTIASVIPVIFSGTIVEIFGVRILLFFLAILCILTCTLSKKYGDQFIQG